MPTVYVITNASCGVCNKFKASGQYDKLLASLSSTGITTYTFHGTHKGDMNFPSGFPADIRRLSSYVPAIIVIPDIPRIDSKSRRILNASVYGMLINPRTLEVYPSGGEFHLVADTIMDWILSQQSSSASAFANGIPPPSTPQTTVNTVIQPRNARLVPTTGSDGSKVIPPVYVYKI